MDVVLTPGPLRGLAVAPPSKSAAHRAAICAMLAKGDSLLTPIQQTDDMEATAAAARALGAAARIEDSRMYISGIESPAPGDTQILDCNESGSTLRFFIPIAAALGVETLFRGQGKLPSRPLSLLTDSLTAHGVSCRLFSGREPDILHISGQLQSGVFSLPGNVSSQYITGLLFALPLLERDSEIHLSTPLESRGYVDMTLQALSAAGVRAESIQNGWRVPGGQKYASGIHSIEGDYSSAAFWLCAGAMGLPVEVSGLDSESKQGDREILDILERFGAQVLTGPTGVVRVTPGTLSGIKLDVSQIPDLTPILAVVAACAEGETVIRGASRLRIKESDRIRSIITGLRALGAEIQDYADCIAIRGRETLSGGVVDSFSDHRIAMAMSIASIRCRRPVTITGAECVTKSYPNFYSHFKRLGGNYYVL